MIRIIAGKYKGRVVHAPHGPSTLRPTLGRVRQILFDLLGPFYFQMAPCVLDGFSGTGALGLEALSRGARHVTFIEKDPIKIKGLQETLSAWQEEIRTSVIAGDFFAYRENKNPVDLVLLDPPYRKDFGRRIFATLSNTPWVMPNTLVVLETERCNKSSIPSDWRLIKERKVGSSQILVLQKVS
ncbi:MAG: 16S rRNA (guanine(966)-N(2))-methyltransferase RsmD [Holosporales bacterium]|jgi:16S rRNA (guanine966-N2)-methyltransferase|nr:16S rRNA (guanine(966)-N(2))-methyltransferase RsmD [Holosporales bacterium]